ncbi:MAG: response regulator [Pseudomonadota bacterium]
MTSSQAVNILLVEDDKIDAKAFMRSMQRMKLANPIVHAKDGVEGWELLQTLPRPNMVILDINMPRMNGLELLRKIRADENLCDTIAFVLTTSNDEQDKFEAYDLNVAGYMLKSEVGDSFMRTVALVESYWSVVEFPNIRSGVGPGAAAPKPAALDRHVG